MNDLMNKTKDKPTDKVMNGLSTRSIGAKEESLKERLTSEPRRMSLTWPISSLASRFVFTFLLCILASSVFWVSESPSQVTKRPRSNSGAQQYCTAIKVPISTNLPIKIAGQEFKSPQKYSAAFKPILSVVELPKGYKAVGGGAGFVIACTQ